MFTDLAAYLHETFPGSGVSLGEVTDNPLTGEPFWSCAPGSPTCGFAGGGSGPVTGGDRHFFDDPFNQPVPIIAGNVNNTTVPVQNNLSGIDRRELSSLSALLTWDLDGGTLISVTSFD